MTVSEVDPVSGAPDHRTISTITALAVRHHRVTRYLLSPCPLNESSVSPSGT